VADVETDALGCCAERAEGVEDIYEMKSVVTEVEVGSQIAYQDRSCGSMFAT
jgi:hypothetical protein